MGPPGVQPTLPFLRERLLNGSEQTQLEMTHTINKKPADRVGKNVFFRWAGDKETRKAGYLLSSFVYVTDAFLN